MPYKSYNVEYKTEKGLLFHHISKTGGSSIHAALQALAEYTGNTFLPVPIGVSKKTKLVKTINGRRTKMPLSEAASEYRFICGHNALDLLPYTRSTHMSSTVLRNPVDRVVSAYFWDHRVRGTEGRISHDDLLDYVRQQKNRNCMAKSFTGMNEKGEYLADVLNMPDAQTAEIAARVVQSFTWRLELSNLKSLLELILSIYGGPCMVIDRIKEETDPRKEQFKAFAAPAITEYNKIDTELLAYANNEVAGIASRLCSNGHSINKRTISVTEVKGTGKLSSTRDLNEFASDAW